MVLVRFFPLDKDEHSMVCRRDKLTLLWHCLEIVGGYGSSVYWKRTSLCFGDYLTSDGWSQLLLELNSLVNRITDSNFGVAWEMSPSLIFN